MINLEIYQFLMELVQTAKSNTVDKLASLCVLKKLLFIETNSDMKEKCVSSEFTSTLVTLIETGLAQHSDPSFAVLVSVAMEIFCHFSQMPVCTIKNHISKPVLRILLAYINLSGSFYTFPKDTKATVAGICENKHLIGRVKVLSMSSETLEQIHRRTNNELKR